ncbi:protein translocase subunit SecF [Candidatus Daviesbacteria bacterium]|nr:protein translocase subunit SecF [Candidatus Daviesbacteria bacterium]
MIDIVSKKWWFFGLSLLLIIPGLVSLILFGLKLSIDFTGDTILQYKFGQGVSQNQVEEQIKSSGVELISARGDDQGVYSIKSKFIDDRKIQDLKSSLSQKFGVVDQISVESVSPVIGSETTVNAFKALIVASALIVLYIAFSFRKVPKPASSWRFGTVAIVALLHDVLVVLGVFSLLGHFLGVEIDVLFVTAVLTVIGFSVHDTIVVFDRIRENLPKHLSKKFAEVANISIIQTLNRSLNTSLTVVLVLLALLLFGGENIRWFVVALLVGIISGTYSSIFNATTLLALWEEKLGH